MKQLSILVFLFFIPIQFSFSQTYMGIKVGVNGANMNINKEFLGGLSSTPNINNENRIGYQLGLITQTDLSSKLFLRSELFYSLKGYKLDDDQHTTAGFNYINLPVLIGYKLLSDISFFLGPQIGLLGPVYNNSGGSRSKNMSNVIGYNKVDVSLGAGVNYTVTPKTSVDLRYNYGFNNILVVDLTDISGNTRKYDFLKNNKTLEISFNYFFRPKQ